MFEIISETFVAVCESIVCDTRPVDFNNIYGFFLALFFSFSKIICKNKKKRRRVKS